MLTGVGLVSHLIAAVGFAVVALITLRRGASAGASHWLGWASVATMAWAATFALAAQHGQPYLGLLSPLETLRSAAWIAVLVLLLRVSWRLDEKVSSSFVIASAMGFVTALQLVLDVAVASGTVQAASLPLAATLFVISRMTVAISGLVLIHNLYLNTDSEGRDAIRLLSIGLAGFFAYDLNLYTLQFLFGRLSPDLYNIRGAVDAIVIPLLLISSSRDWAGRIQVSRQVAFHTVSFSMIGVYLIAMALVSYGLRLVAGDWGRLLQISFLFATVILAVIVLVSPQFRARLRVLIAKNFFTYKYDYRQEWLRFIETVSYSRSGADTLPESVIQAVCAVVDSPGGVLFTPDEDGGYSVSARWKLANFNAQSFSATSDLANFITQRQRIIDFDELREGRGDYGTMRPPNWAALDRRVWLGVPLVHIDYPAGLLVLERTVAKRELNWEDYDLLRTLGRQGASYIAEAASQEALDEAGKFDEFNRRFAFIMHDIKNLVSQLSLLARNAERHAENPAFRADMVATLQSSVGKMNDMLARLAQHNNARPETPRAIDLYAMAQHVIAAKQRSYNALALIGQPGPHTVIGEANKLEQIVSHLVQNAIDASSGAPIHVGFQRHGNEIVVTIRDSGVGMSASFIRGDLFKPFHSTKVGGFGIGAYEARTMVRSMGGRLDVSSEPGNGTTFTISLPAADDQSMGSTDE